MNIEQTWQKSDADDPVLSGLLAQGGFDKRSSQLPFKKLKKNLATGMVYNIVITIAYITVLLLFPIWQVQLSFVMLILFNAWILVDSLRLYNRVPETISPQQSVKEVVKKNYDDFQRWWAIQLRSSLFIYPVAAAGGFILGGVLGSGKSVETFLYNPKMLLILAVTVLVLTPICHWIAKWMFQYVYGKHMAQLKNFLDELD